MSESESLRKQIGQLINVRIGSNMNPCVTVADDFERVAELVDRYSIGSLCLFNGSSSAEVLDTLARLQDRSETPLLVGADMECGSGQQIKDHTTFPHAMAFAASGVDAVEQAARITAAEARSVGIHVSFSPVADIHRNPQNPIIATRAFGTNADQVIEFASAYIRGCHAGGALCSVKHFPGHGNTHEDSHAVLPVVSEPRDVLEQTDLRPFKTLCASGVDMVMTAHVAYPALDPTGVPATLSYPILTKLLRDQWRFDGVVVSDSFKMDGLRKHHGCEGQLAVAAVAAGVDLLLDVTDVPTIIEAMVTRAASEERFANRISVAAERVAALKRRALDSDESSSSGVDAQPLAHRIAAQAISVIGDQQLPLAQPIPAVVLNPQGDVGYTNTSVLRDLLAASPNVLQAHYVVGDEDREQLTAASEAAQKSGGCFVAFVMAPSAWQRYGLPDWQTEFVTQVTQTCPTIVASLGITEPLAAFTSASSQIATFSDTSVSQRALVERVFGLPPK